MEKLTPFVRIALYYIAGRLGSAGLPVEAVGIISSDPILLEVATNVASLAIVGVVMVWWRVAKRLGLST